MNIYGGLFSGHRAAAFNGQSTCVGAYTMARGGRVPPPVSAGMVAAMSLFPALKI